MGCLGAPEAWGPGPGPSGPIG